MLPYHNIDPVAFSLGSFVNVHWYGIMYVLAFIFGWCLLRVQAERPGALLDLKKVEDLVTWIILGVLLGGRLGYILFYDLPYYLESPLDVFRVWNGGMSFHGGFLGVALALFLWSYKHKIQFLELTDFIVPIIPLGLFFGRLGNFINGELWGLPASLPWAMQFPRGGATYRHPTQLYEALFEGILLFLVLWFLARKKHDTGFLSGLFCIGYALSRSFCEIFRVPDPQYGYFFEYITMGQILSLPMLILGILLLRNAHKHKLNPTHDTVHLADGTVLYVRRTLKD